MNSRAYSEFNPDKVTEIIGISPTSVWTPNDWQEELLSQTKTMPKGFGPTTTWRIETDYYVCDSIDYTIQEIMKTLKGREDNILKACGLFDLKACFTVVVHSYFCMSPAMKINRDVIQFLSRINSNIDIDFYSYPEGNDGLHWT